MRYLSIPISILLFISTCMIFPCKAAPVWSDNFDSGNYNGWIVTNGTWIDFCPNGIFNTENHTLACIGIGMIMHPSTITTGTWSFDLLGMNEWTFDIELMFMNTGGTQYNTALGVHFVNDAWYPYACINGLGSMQFLVPYPSIDMSAWTGWQHFDITRDSDGRICVYHNGTIVMDIPPSSSSTSVTTSEYFFIGFGLTSGAINADFGAIDNIVVSNTVDIQPPQLPFYRQTWFLATVGTIIVMVVVVTVFLLRRRKSKL